MLTKEYLKHKVRSGRIHPLLIDPQKAESVALADRALSCARSYEGQPLQSLQEEIQTEEKQFQALVRLATCDEDDSEKLDFSEQRWKWLLSAEELRHEAPNLTQEEFRVELARRLDAQVSELQKQLYSDLPEMNPVHVVKDSTATRLIESYNLAQVQGLLLRARSLKLSLVDPSVSELRFVVRMLKFFQLVLDISATSKTLQIAVTGSLDVLGIAQPSYGRNLAKFFPCLLAVRKWKLEADIIQQSKHYELKLEPASSFGSGNKFTLQYVPEEFEHFAAQLQKQLPGWMIRCDGEIKNLGNQNYAVPDFTLRSPGGEVIAIEVFHRFHHGQLRNRLIQLDQKSSDGLIMGISTKLTQNEDIQQQLAKAQERGVLYFEFRDFPTARSALAAIKSLRARQALPLDA